MRISLQLVAQEQTLAKIDIVPKKVIIGIDDEKT